MESTLKLKSKSVADTKSMLNIETDFALSFNLDFDITVVDFNRPISMHFEWLSTLIST